MADKLTFTSPKGVAVYPRLNTPDTKFDENGAYKADLSMPRDIAEPLIKKLVKIYKDHTGKAHPKNPERDSRVAFFYNELDDDGDDTGNVVFKLRVKNKIVKRTGDLWDRRPAQFDAKGHPITTALNIGGGSVLKVSFEVYCWATPDGTKGMSLQPEAVQVLELKEFVSNRDADSYGFGEEDGYEASDEDSGDDHGFDDETSDDGDDDYVPADEGDEDDY